MMITLIIIWSLFWFVVSSLAIVHLFDEVGCSDMEDICCITGLSIFLGLIWPITIWVALAKWYDAGCQPYWAEALCKLYNFIIRKRS